MIANRRLNHSEMPVATRGVTFMRLVNAGFVAMVAASALNAGTAAAQPLVVKEDAAQYAADKAALQRQLNRLYVDEAQLKKDRASGRMSAVSRDALEVYRAQRAVKGEKTAIADDKAASLQMQADRAALQRQIQRLQLAEARLKADREEGKMAAMSSDAERVYKDEQAIKGENKDIAADQAKLKTDRRKL